MIEMKYIVFQRDGDTYVADCPLEVSHPAPPIQGEDIAALFRNYPKFFDTLTALGVRVTIAQPVDESFLKVENVVD